jgi:hypothetical protein
VQEGALVQIAVPNPTTNSDKKQAQ